MGPQKNAALEAGQINLGEKTIVPPAFLISLCVPTYNRASLLDLALRTVIDQIPQDQKAHVEIIVSDNASPDATQSVIEQIRSDHPSAALRYYRQPYNLGPDANIYQAVRMARGEFVYILSDDDVLLPGAMQKLLTMIREYPSLDAFALNIRVFDQDWRTPAPPELPLPSDCVIHDKGKALFIFNTWIRFLSTMAFRRRLVQDTDYTGRFGSRFIHAYIYLDVLQRGRGVAITSEPFLAQRDGNTTVFDYCRVYVTDFSAVMQYAASLGFPKYAIQKIHRRNVRIIKDVVYANTVRGAWGEFLPDTHDAIRRLMQVYPFNLVVLLRVIPVLLIPRKAVPLLYKVYKSLKTVLRLGQRQP